MKRRFKLMLTCEHGGNKIPSAYRSAFKSADAALKTHRGWDIGALEVAKKLSEKMRAALHFSETSRLLIDLNRSIGHKRLHSEWSKPLPRAERAKIQKIFYDPYRSKVEKAAKKSAGSLRVPLVILSIHSFTPYLKGETRNCEVGFLYDPSWPLEKKLSSQLKKEIQNDFPDLRVRMNYPYRGTDDGFPTYLRKLFRRDAFCIIEIELNQGYLMRMKEAKRLDMFANALAETLQRGLEATFNT